MSRTSSLLRIGLQDPLEDVMAAQAPDGIVVDGVHTGAEVSNPHKRTALKVQNLTCQLPLGKSRKNDG